MAFDPLPSTGDGLHPGARLQHAVNVARTDRVIRAADEVAGMKFTPSIRTNAVGRPEKEGGEPMPTPMPEARQNGAQGRGAAIPARRARAKTADEAPLTRDDLQVLMRLVESQQNSEIRTTSGRMRI